MARSEGFGIFLNVGIIFVRFSLKALYQFYISFTYLPRENIIPQHRAKTVLKKTETQISSISFRRLFFLGSWLFCSLIFKTHLWPNMSRLIITFLLNPFWYISRDIVETDMFCDLKPAKNENGKFLIYVRADLITLHFSNATTYLLL